MLRRYFGSPSNAVPRIIIPSQVPLSPRYRRWTGTRTPPEKSIPWRKPWPMRLTAPANSTPVPPRLFLNLSPGGRRLVRMRSTGTLRLGQRGPGVPSGALCAKRSVTSSPKGFRKLRSRICDLGLYLSLPHVSLRNPRNQGILRNPQGMPAI